MNKQKLIFGAVGAFSVLAIVVLTVISLVMQDSYSILNSFISELGKYSSGYLSSSVALLFNIALVVSGILMCAFFVGFGIEKSETLYTVSSFFGILTGVLIAAQGVFTLNVASIHYMFTTILFASVFFMCGFYIAASFVNSKGASLPGLILSLAAGALGAVFAFFVQLGNLPDLLSVSFADRATFIPFAVVEWAALLLVFAFSGLLSTKMILSAFASQSISADPSAKIRMPLFNKKNDRNMDF